MNPEYLFSKYPERFYNPEFNSRWIILCFVEHLESTFGILDPHRYSILANIYQNIEKDELDELITSKNVEFSPLDKDIVEMFGFTNWTDDPFKIYSDLYDIHYYIYIEVEPNSTGINNLDHKMINSNFIYVIENNVNKGLYGIINHFNLNGILVDALYSTYFDGEKRKLIDNYQNGAFIPPVIYKYNESNHTIQLTVGKTENLRSKNEISLYQFGPLNGNNCIAIECIGCNYRKIVSGCSIFKYYIDWSILPTVEEDSNECIFTFHLVKNNYEANTFPLERTVTALRITNMRELEKPYNILGNCTSWYTIMNPTEDFMHNLKPKHERKVNCNFVSALPFMNIKDNIMPIIPLCNDKCVNCYQHTIIILLEKIYDSIDGNTKRTVVFSMTIKYNSDHSQEMINTDIFDKDNLEYYRIIIDLEDNTYLNDQEDQESMRLIDLGMSLSTILNMETNEYEIYITPKINLSYPTLITYNEELDEHFIELRANNFVNRFKIILTNPDHKLDCDCATEIIDSDWILYKIPIKK